MTSTNGVVYEAIQRTFRNAVVAHIRSRLAQKYGEDAETHLAKAFPTWPDIKDAAAQSSTGGVVDHPHADEYSYLDVSHFAVLFNENFEVLVDVDGLPPEVCKTLKRQLGSFLREIKTIRDPVSHPGDEDLDAYDSLRAIDSARRVTLILGLSEAAAALEAPRHELSSFAAELPAVTISVDSSVDGLPPRDTVVLEFVGRRPELGQLREWLVDPHAKRWLLTGDGGKGKSAIAYQLATEVTRRRDLDFAAVHWLSAKRRRYTEGDDIAISNPDFSDLETAVDRLLTVLGWSEHVDKPLVTKRLLLCQLVGEFPCFLVVDDIDSLDPSQEDAIEFLVSELPAAGAKVLLTSRRNILGMGQSATVVQGLSDVDADEFVASRLALFEIDPDALTTQQRKRMINLCEGSPLYLEDLLRLCTFLPVNQALTSWQENMGEKVRSYALDRELEMLSTTARDVLEAACIVNGPMTALEAQHILGEPEEEILEGLRELRQHHLVPALELIEDVPRFTVNANLRLLVFSALEGTERRRKLEAAVAAVSGDGLLTKGSREIEDYRRQAEVLLRSRQFERAEETLRKGMEQHPNHPELYATLGSLYSRWAPKPRVIDARNAWKRSFELGSQDVRVFVQWTQLEARQEEWQLMREAAERGLKRSSSDNPALLQQAGYAASRLGQSLAESFNSTRAVEEFGRSDEFLRSALKAGKDQRIEPRVISRSYKTMVINALFQRDDREVCRRMRLWLEWDSSDPMALENAERHRGRCPEIARYVNPVRPTAEVSVGAST
jgi:hypothetical protein